ncbi:MAG: NAD(P)-dependent oxidoreductase [Longimicrobiales bacterium]
MSGELRTLVTGAGGFIGGRIVEALLQLDGRTPVAGLRRWSTAARIGRYPIEPVQCDIMNPGQLATVMDGLDSVIHSAVGNRTVTVEGTRNVMQAALDAGVRKVIHLSTVDVYGRATGPVPETRGYERTGREYGDSKIEAEEVCVEYAGRGLDVIMLRPTIVYGPFSELWTVEPAQRLATGSWLLPREACQGTCNLVHVDDLVRAALLGLEAEGLAGRGYNINGPDRPTWQAYVEALNRALGLPPFEPPPPASSKARTTIVEPFRKAVKGVYFRFEDPIMSVYKSSRAARRAMKWLQGALLRVPSPAEYDLYSRVVDFPTERAEADLGYRPSIGMAAGVASSAGWLLHEGVVQVGA